MYGVYFCQTTHASNHINRCTTCHCSLLRSIYTTYSYVSVHTKIVMILFPLWTRVDRNAPKPCPHNIHKIQLKIPKLYTNYTSNHQKPISTFPEPHEPRKTNKKAWLMKKSLDKMGRDFIPTKSLKQPGALAACSNRGSRLGGDSETAGGLVGSTRSTSSQWLNI